MWNEKNVLCRVLPFPYKCHLTCPIEALWSVAALLFVVYERSTMWCIFCVTTIKRLLSVCYDDDDVDAVQIFYDKLTLFFALCLLVVWSFFAAHVCLFFFRNDVLENGCTRKNNSKLLPPCQQSLKFLTVQWPTQWKGPRKWGPLKLNIVII